jgi:transcriptional regulator NrdR family protein
MTWRRRECLNCSSIVTTHEKVDYSAALRVRIRDGSLQPFQRDRLMISLHNSLTHRADGLRDASELSDTIMRDLAGLHTNGVLDTAHISAVAYKILQRFDSAAATYYVAHHPTSKA